MADPIPDPDVRTMVVVLAAGLLFVGLLALAASGVVGAGAGSETSACLGRLH